MIEFEAKEIREFKEYKENKESSLSGGDEVCVEMKVERCEI